MVLSCSTSQLPRALPRCGSRSSGRPALPSAPVHSLHPAPRASLGHAYSAPQRTAGAASRAVWAVRAAPHAMASAAKAKPVEHVVLFKLKPGTEEAAAAAMVSELAALESLPGVLHLCVGPRVHPLPAAGAASEVPGGAWTHALYGRYESKEALSSYATSDAHMAVVVNQVRPIAEEIIALDWELEGAAKAAAETHGAQDKGARVLRAYMLEISDEDISAALGQGLEGAAKIQGAIGGGSTVRWISVGKNFAGERSKGHTWGLLAAFPDEESLGRFASDAEQEKLIGAALVGVSKKYACIDFKVPSKL